MELYHLKTFVTVADEGHLTRAAERLHTSQPAVSAHIKALEEELEVTLFLRTPRGMLLTREGALLKETAETAMASFGEFRLQAARIRERVAGTVRIGLHIDPRYLRIEQFLSYMRKKYPELDYHLLQKWSWQQPEEFKRGELEAGFVYGRPEDPELAVVALSRFNVVVVGPAAWQARLDAADWEDIADMPWVWTSPECTFCQVAEAAFEQRGLKPNKITVADQEPVVKALVLSGVGISFMIENEAKDARDRGEISIWKSAIDTVDLSFVYPGARISDPLVRAIIDGVENVWEVEIHGGKAAAQGEPASSTKAPGRPAIMRKRRR